MAEHSRLQADFIADIVLQKPELIDELIQIVFRNKEPLSRRASWPLRIISDRNAMVLQPYLPFMIDSILQLENVSILRAILAILVNSDIPESHQGEMLQFTSEILINSNSPVALLIYSSDIFYKLSLNEPELLNELRLMLEQLLPFGSAGVKSKCRKILKKIEKANYK